MERVRYVVVVHKPGSDDEELVRLEPEQPLGPYVPGQSLCLMSFPDKGRFDVEATIREVKHTLYSAHAREVVSLTRIYLGVDAKKVAITPSGRVVY